MYLLVLKPLINKIGFVQATSIHGWVLWVRSVFREHILPTTSQNDLVEDNSNHSNHMC